MLTFAAIAIAKINHFIQTILQWTHFSISLLSILLYTLMSKSFREGFVCWLYGFYSAGKYIHLIALQMVRLWINEQVILWIEELKKNGFYWVCDLCFSISYTSAVPFSPYSLWPLLVAFQPDSSPPISTPCVILHTIHHINAASCLQGPAWAGTCFCSVPCPVPGA